MSAGIYFIEGFEGDDYSLVWETVGMTKSSDHARTGDNGIGHAALGYARSESPLFPATTGICIGFAFRNRPDLPGDPGAAVWGGQIPILQIRGPTDLTHVVLMFDAQHLLSVWTYNGAGELTVRGVGSRQLDDNAFYYVEIAAIAHATAGRIVVQINGPGGPLGVDASTDIDVSGIPTLAPGATGPVAFYNQFHVGVMGGFLNEARNMSFDDFYDRDAAEGFLGDQQVYLRDLEDDRSVDFIRLSGPKNYLMVNELAPDEDTTENETDIDGAEDIFEIADTVFTGPIHCVQLVARAKKTQTQIWTLECLIELAGVKAYGPAYYLSHPDYETLPPVVFGTAPGDLPWNAARLNALGVGYRALAPAGGS